MELILFWILLPFIPILVCGLIGMLLQHMHYQAIDRREAETAGVLALTYDPVEWQAARSELVRGSAVVAPDYLRSFLAGLKGLFGGRLRSLEPVLDRGRREAMLRMKEAAQRAGHDAVVNVRLETSRIATARSDGKGTRGIELVAYGTAITRA